MLVGGGSSRGRAGPGLPRVSPEMPEARPAAPPSILTQGHATSGLC